PAALQHVFHRLIVALLGGLRGIPALQLLLKGLYGALNQLRGLLPHAAKLLLERLREPIRPRLLVLEEDVGIGDLEAGLRRRPRQRLALALPRRADPLEGLLLELLERGAVLRGQGLKRVSDRLRGLPVQLEGLVAKPDLLVFRLWIGFQMRLLAHDVSNRAAAARPWSICARWRLTMRRNAAISWQNPSALSAVRLPWLTVCSICLSTISMHSLQSSAVAFMISAADWPRWINSASFGSNSALIARRASLLSGRGARRLAADLLPSSRRSRGPDGSAGARRRRGRVPIPQSARGYRARCPDRSSTHAAQSPRAAAY